MKVEKHIVVDEHVRVVSDGTPFGTHVFINGQELRTCRAVRFEIDPDRPARLTLELYVDEFALAGDIPVSVVAVPVPEGMKL